MCMSASEVGLPPTPHSGSGEPGKADTTMAVTLLERLVEAENLSADDVRGIVSAATRLYANACARAGEELPPVTQQVSTTDAIMLACALALAAVAWAGAAFWGEAQDTDAEGTPGAQPSLSEQAPAGPSPSSGEASAPSQSDPANTAPAETDPTPPSATGGDSQSVTPDGTQSAPVTAPQQ